MLSVFFVLAGIQACLAVAGAVLFLATPKSKRTNLLPIGLLLIASAGTDIAGFVLFFVFQKGSNLLQNIYTIAETVFIIVFFRNALGKTGTLNIYNISILVFVTFSIINLTSFQGAHTINSYTKAGGGFLVIIFCLTYFYYLIQNLPAENLTSFPSFWIATGILVHTAGAIIIFIFTDYLVNVMKNNLIYYWSFHNLLVITKHLMVLFGLWKNRQTHNLA